MGLVSWIFGNKARKAKKAANEAQLYMTRLKNRQAKRAFLRNFRQAQAQTLSAGIASGADITSSGIQGQMSSNISQARQALWEFKWQAQKQTYINSRLNDADRYGMMASIATNLEQAGVAIYQGTFRQPQGGAPAPTTQGEWGFTQDSANMGSYNPLPSTFKVGG